MSNYPTIAGFSDIVKGQRSIDVTNTEVQTNGWPVITRMGTHPGTRVLLYNNTRRSEVQSKAMAPTQIDYGLIGRHHDGGVRNVFDQLCSETAVDTTHSLVAGNLHQRLPESVIPTAFLAHPSTSHFYNTQINKT